MANDRQSLHQTKSDLAIGAMTLVLYALLAVVFFGFLSISNIYLRVINRTLVSTALIFCAMMIATHAIYGGFDVGRKKSKPVISAMIAGTVLTDLAAYLQMEVMNVNDNNNDHLVLFGPDLLYLFIGIVVQILVIIVFVRLGNALYFHFHPPRKALLVIGDPSQEKSLRAKVERYKLQWQVEDTVLFSDPDIRARIRKAEVVFLGDIPETDKDTLLKYCYARHKDIMCKAELQEAILCNGRPAIVDDAPFLEIEYYKMSFFQRMIKRAGDITISLISLLILSPLMAVIAAAIKLEDKGPVIFNQKRLTIGGKKFIIHKFRTMKPEASQENLPVSIAVNDPRITRVGRILRRFRLDETPQFFNVLKGEMSLVGPRPEMISNVNRYKTERPDFVYREKMKAGITGYAQIEGRYNTTAEDKLMLDLMYIESFSIWLDVKLLMRTVTVLFKKESTKGFEKPIETTEDKKEGENKNENHSADHGGRPRVPLRREQTD